MPFIEREYMWCVILLSHNQIQVSEEQKELFILRNLRTKKLDKKSFLLISS